MTENSKIEWCDHTFNPWIGCTKVSPACDNCYAESWSARFKRATWGNHPRQRTAASTWRQPLKWNREAAARGVRARVFCASLADWLDNHRSITSGLRGDLWHLIHSTPNLDWLLLSKRLQNFGNNLPETYGLPAWGDGWPNVWIGTTVENQEEANRRIPLLLDTPARVRFVSMEPLLGPVDLTAIDTGSGWVDCLQSYIRYPALPEGHYQNEPISLPSLDWVIAGGESGPGARPSHPGWFRNLRDQCAAADVPFFMKQMTKKAPIPDDLTVREFPYAN